MPNMGAIDSYLSEPLLDGTAAQEFRRGHAQVSARHRAWRENFPAIGLLLDTDEDRAQALAGNYATEARETVEVWLSVFDADPSPDVDVEDCVRWIEGLWDAWRAWVFESEDFVRLDEGPRRRFVTIFDDLSGRFRVDAVTVVRDNAERGSESPSIAERLSAPLRAIGRVVRGFFFPSVRG